MSGDGLQHVQILLLAILGQILDFFLDYSDRLSAEATEKKLVSVYSHRDDFLQVWRVLLEIPFESTTECGHTFVNNCIDVDSLFQVSSVNPLRVKMRQAEKLERVTVFVVGDNVCVGSWEYCGRGRDTGRSSNHERAMTGSGKGDVSNLTMLSRYASTHALPSVDEDGSDPR